MASVDNSPKSFQRRRLLSRVLVVVALLLWFGLYNLTNYYDQTRPTTANTDSENIFALNSHGHIVFLTFRDEIAWWLLCVAATSCFFSGLVIDRRLKRLSNNSGEAIDTKLNNPSAK